MTQPALDELAEYVLGTLPEPRRHELSALIDGSAELRHEVQAVREALGALPPGGPPVRPRADARAALLRALDDGERFSPFLDDLARHFDLAKTRVRELFDWIDDARRWEPGPIMGISVMHFAGGPQAIAPDAGFVRFPKGFRFPMHRHIGHEVNYVLQGAVRDGDGMLYLPGEALIMAPHTTHTFSIPEDAATLIAVVQAGFELV
jgi:hypothetical protein